MSIPSAVLNWITSATGLDTWQSPISTDAEKPAGEYSTFKILSVAMSDFNALEVAGKDADYITKTSYNNAVILLSVNVFAINGYQALIDLNASGDYWESRYALAQDGLTIGRLGNPKNLTGLGDSNFVDRWQMDIELRVKVETKKDWDRLKVIQLSGKFLRSDESGDIITVVKWPTS